MTLLPDWISWCRSPAGLASLGRWIQQLATGGSKAASGECDWVTANRSWLLSGASRVQSAEKDRGKHQRNTERRTLDQSNALQLATPTRPLQVYSSIVPKSLRFRVAWGSEHFRCARRKFGSPHLKVTCDVGKHCAVIPRTFPGHFPQSLDWKLASKRVAPGLIVTG
ncbi:hypothetical protein BDW69DRAFT_94789 [Aspergillus filifer]